MIASGGVSDIRDIERLVEIEREGVIGVIAGKALCGYLVPERGHCRGRRGRS